MSDDEKPIDADALFLSLLKSNAKALSVCDTQLREAQDVIKRVEAEQARLRNVREGLQAGRQAVLAGQGAQPSPSA